MAEHPSTLAKNREDAEEKEIVLACKLQLWQLCLCEGLDSHFCRSDKPHECTTFLIKC